MNITSQSSLVEIVGAQMDWESWQCRWDAQQLAYMPDREERFTAMLDAVEAACGPTARVLDLAGGTGSITRRLLARLPHATSILLDVDAALLTIAGGSFSDEVRVRVIRADLATPSWRDELGEPDGSVDAVLTATALHWLAPERVAGVYAEAAALLRPGGLIMNADQMPDPGLPSLSAGLERIADARTDGIRATTGAPDWAGWWDEVRADPALAGPAAERDVYFGQRAGNSHTESALASDWHISALLVAGCSEAGLLWRGLRDAVVVGQVSAAA